MDGLKEVMPLREVPKDPECCGEKMKRMQNVALGQMVTVYVCGKCTRQVRPQEKKNG